MSKPSDHPGFKELLKEWNQKLYESGFRDVEVMREGELILKWDASERRHQRMDEVVREARAQFFRSVAECVVKTQFESDLERRILSLYAQGMSQAAIQRKLCIKGHRCKVYIPLYRWLEAWGLKWTRIKSSLSQAMTQPSSPTEP